MSIKLDPITKLSPRIIRILGFNPGLMTLQGTNTYVIGEGQKRILLDTGQRNKPEYIDALRSVLDETDINLAHIIFTHWHLDHTGGLSDVYKNFNDDTTVWKFKRSDADNPKLIDNIPMKYLKNHQEISVDGATLKVIHTPGHTTDHIVLHLKEEDSLFTGDCVLGTGTSVFEDLHDYVKSLQLILKLDSKKLYPGHGPVVDDVRSKVESYITHRQDREDQILEVLIKQKGRSITPSNIVKAIYTDAPERLQIAAESNVNIHLKKLKKEGKVKEISGEWCLIEEKQSLSN